MKNLLIILLLLPLALNGQILGQVDMNVLKPCGHSDIEHCTYLCFENDCDCALYFNAGQSNAQYSRSFIRALIDFFYGKSNCLPKEKKMVSFDWTRGGTEIEQFFPGYSFGLWDAKYAELQDTINYMYDVLGCKNISVSGNWFQGERDISLLTHLGYDYQLDRLYVLFSEMFGCAPHLQVHELLYFNTLDSSATDTLNAHLLNFTNANGFTWIPHDSTELGADGVHLSDEARRKFIVKMLEDSFDKGCGCVMPDTLRPSPPVELTYNWRSTNPDGSGPFTYWNSRADSIELCTTNGLIDLILNAEPTIIQNNCTLTKPDNSTQFSANGIFNLTNLDATDSGNYNMECEDATGTNTYDIDFHVTVTVDPTCN